ncbi:MAG TPA: hypothetical protein DEG09_08890 [Marinilabiliaceae bacterium]|nr:hypothetical protein [Marinilabiliaceae bacterium]HBX88714.1 hypothetical protein [Marinilabiliaceae bacterium]
MKKLLSGSILLLSLGLGAQNVNIVPLDHLLRDIPRKEIRIPNVLGYQTLKCDFHMHTIFSDGDVWPAVRVQEAWEEGLDAI